MMIMISIILTLICGGFGWKIWEISKKNMNDKIIDNGSSLSVTVGVIFTFVGIAIALWNFDTDSNKMADNINLFLEGMKTAFWTSIVGMVFGVYIKWKQSAIEQEEDKNLNKILKENIGNINKNLSDIKNSIDANGNVALQEEINSLVTVMRNFIAAPNSFRSDMKELSDSMKNQVTTINNLSIALTKNIENLLTETKIYQQQSLANDKTQARILSDNTEQIAAMKKSFDSFLDTMAKNYSRALIDALNESIKKLNTQLQTQFGDNFKELNNAVADVVKWQENYKITVEKTTGELEQLNAVFKTFSEKIVSQVDKHIETMAENLGIFADTSNKNIAVQKNLSDTVILLSKSVQNAKDSVEQMQRLIQSFGSFSEQVIKVNNKAIEDYKSNVTKNLESVAQANEKFATEIKKLQNTALTVRTDTEQNIKEFGDASKKAMGEIRKTLETFNTDFSKETKTSLENLQKVFNQISKNTEKQSDDAVTTLAGSLSAITDQMIGNYNALIVRIAELDALIRKEDDKK